MSVVDRVEVGETVPEVEPTEPAVQSQLDEQGQRVVLVLD